MYTLYILGIVNYCGRDYSDRDARVRKKSFMLTIISLFLFPRLLYCSRLSNNCGRESAYYHIPYTARIHLYYIIIYTYNYNNTLYTYICIHTEAHVSPFVWRRPREPPRVPIDCRTYFMTYMIYIYRYRYYLLLTLRVRVRTVSLDEIFLHSEFNHAL